MQAGGATTSRSELKSLTQNPQRRKASDGPRSLNLEELEADAVRQALRRTDGNRVQAAKLLGIHRDTLLVKLKKYGIEKEGN